MKKLVLAFLAVGAIASAQAQQKAGSILLYGNAGLNAVRNVNDIPSQIGPDVETKDIEWNVTPGVGFQFDKNWTVGVNFDISGNTSTQNNNSGLGDIKDRYTQFVVGPFLRYHMPLGRTFFSFFQLNTGYLTKKRIQENPGLADVEDRYNGFNVNFTPAIGVNLTRKVALNFGIGGLGYKGVVINYDDANAGERRENNFYVTFGQQFHWGVSVNLGGYKHMRGNSEPGMDSRRMNTDDEDGEEAPRRKRRANDDEE
jgi:hypothetical protein